MPLEYYLNEKTPSYPVENVDELLISKAVVDELYKAQVAEALHQLDRELALCNSIAVKKLIEVESDELVF